MPRGHQLFKEKDVLAAVPSRGVTAAEILRELNDRLPQEHCMSYNTLRKYLDDLCDQGKIEAGNDLGSRRVLYRRKKK